jgi:diaminohydroxyphosphoribosylaminopyrimidine deaminase/5-amino-6-(5-phosphoribosylamino)uracil reductase
MSNHLKGGIVLDLDQHYMQVALNIAGAAQGQTNPNPLVGAVIVKEQQIVGLGAHLKAGEPHAEVHALRMAGEKAQGATMYVTLEPCSHYGRTPPCADQVIAAGIQKVFVATLDPNPLVAGSGVQKLLDAGIEVEIGLLQQEAERLNEVFNHFIVQQKPFVTLKTATTLDGKIATVTGESKWITSEEARRDVHLLRHQHDAILVGVQTVIQDDPQLTTRLADGEGKHPVRVILDSRLRTPLESKVVNIPEAETWLFTTKQVSAERIGQYEQKGVRVFQTSGTERVDIDEVLHILGREKIASLLVEGGGEVNASFLTGGYVNKVIQYIAPKLIGGHVAPGPFRGEGIHRIDDALQLQDVRLERLGQDIKVIGYIKSSSSERG